MGAARTERVVTGGFLALAVVMYTFWLVGRQLSLWQPGDVLELTFNSMLEHLLRGEFDVDPAVVGPEGFRRDGRVYAYWGIFFAILRWPLTLIPGGLGLDVTRLSCLVAVCLAAFAKLRTLRLVFVEARPSPTRRVLYWTAVLTVLFAGPQVQFLRQSIYQEVCLWAGALAAVFVYFAVRGVTQGRFPSSSLCAMAALAGLALLARVSMGVALYAALALLLLTMLVQQLRDAPHRRSGATLVLPALILVAFAGVAAFVNHQRWGDPLTFADYRFYILNAQYPDRLPRTLEYGLFNPARAPFGFVYYFFPIWVLRRADGHLLLEEHQRRLFDVTELPPSSFLLTDALLILLCLYAGWSLLTARRSGGLDRSRVVAIAAGLAAGPALMLCAISMNFRYRIEFYPPMEFGAFLGLVLLCRRPPVGAWAQRVRPLAIASTALGILASNVVLLLYRVSPPGPPIDQLRRGFVHFYLSEFQSYFTALAAFLRS